MKEKSTRYSAFLLDKSGLNLQPPDDCLLRSLGNQCLNLDSRRVTIQEYLTLVPSYG